MNCLVAYDGHHILNFIPSYECFLIYSVTFPYALCSRADQQEDK